MSDHKTPLELAKEARAYADKATPGPWAQLDGFPEYVVPAAEQGRPLGASACPEEYARAYAHPIVGAGWLEMPLLDDTAFVARARTDVPALCAAIEVLHADNERLRAALVSIEEYWNGHPGSTVDAAHEMRERARAALEVKP